MDPVDRLPKQIYAIASAIALLVFLGIVFLLWPLSSEKFNKDAWQRTIADKESSTCYRGNMAKDIVKNHLSAEMKQQEIIALLGTPDTDKGAGEIRYILGMCSGLGFDYDALHIYFKKSGEFSHAKIYQH